MRGLMRSSVCGDVLNRSDPQLTEYAMSLGLQAFLACNVSLLLQGLRPGAVSQSVFPSDDEHTRGIDGGDIKIEPNFTDSGS